MGTADVIFLFWEHTSICSNYTELLESHTKIRKPQTWEWFSPLPGLRGRCAEGSLQATADLSSCSAIAFTQQTQFPTALHHLVYTPGVWLEAPTPIFLPHWGGTHTLELLSHDAESFSLLSRLAELSRCQMQQPTTQQPSFQKKQCLPPLEYSTLKKKKAVGYNWTPLSVE